MEQDAFEPADVLDFWFPATGHQHDAVPHGRFWQERMQRGMDAAIIERFAGLTLAAATGRLDHWAAVPRGRLALLIALDQFPRSLWRDKPAAYAQDIKAARLALEGLWNGHFDVLEPWEQSFYVIAIAHCEGPGHLERMDPLGETVESIISRLPEALAHLGEGYRSQHARVREIIRTFGRHRTATRSSAARRRGPSAGRRRCRSRSTCPPCRA